MGLTDEHFYIMLSTVNHTTRRVLWDSCKYKLQPILWCMLSLTVSLPSLVVFDLSKLLCLILWWFSQPWLSLYLPNVLQGAFIGVNQWQMSGLYQDYVVIIDISLQTTLLDNPKSVTLSADQFLGGYKMAVKSVFIDQAKVTNHTRTLLAIAGLSNCFIGTCSDVRNFG